MNRIESPRDQVTGVLDDPDRLSAVTDALRTADFSDDDVIVVAGDEALAVVDPDGRAHGLFGRLTRSLEHFGQEGEEHHAAADEVREGHVLLAVRVRSDQDKDRAAATLGAQGVRRLRYWGRWDIEAISD